MSTNLKLRQRLLTSWEEHHQEFKLLSEVYDQKWKQMKEAKLKTGHNVFKIFSHECPGLMKFLMAEGYGDARRCLNDLSENELVELIEEFDDYIEFFLRKIHTTISDYNDRLLLGKHSCYAMGGDSIYYLRQEKRKSNQK